MKPKTLLEIVHQAIVDALERNKGNRTKAAKELDISRRTIRNYLAKGIGVDVKRYGAPVVSIEVIRRALKKYHGYVPYVTMQTSLTKSKIIERIKEANEAGDYDFPPLRDKPHPADVQARRNGNIHSFCSKCAKKLGTGHLSCRICKAYCDRQERNGLVSKEEAIKLKKNMTGDEF